MRLPIIAIVGRPNTGKSTLFNFLIGKRFAVTSSAPGTTRDRIYKEASLGKFSVMYVDTGGLQFDTLEPLERHIHLQAKLAIEDADIIYFVVDASEELTSLDREAARLLRHSKKPIVLIAHKFDRKKAEENFASLYKLGFDEPYKVSSLQNMGFDSLQKATLKKLKKLGVRPVKKTKENIISVSIIGRPNVGKSSLVNALIGSERFIISDIPGTTRDSADTKFTFQNQIFNIIDTAGLRRRAKRGTGLEKLSSLRSLEAITRSDVCVLMLSYEDGVTKGDLNLSHYILEAKKGLIIAVNKCDLMEDRKNDENSLISTLRYKMDFLPWAPVLFVSAKNKRNIFKIFDLAKQIREEREKRIPEKDFNFFLEGMQVRHPAPSKGKYATKIFNGKQAGQNPPVFTLFTNNPDGIHFSYRRFVENEIRKKFGFTGTAIELSFRHA